MALLVLMQLTITISSSPLFLDQRFFEILQHQDKVNAGLMARLSELNDYGFFSSTGNLRSVLNQEGISIIRLHQTSNESLQKAFASFIKTPIEAPDACNNKVE